MLPKGSNAVIMEEDTEELNRNMIEIKNFLRLKNHLIRMVILYLNWYKIVLII